MNIQLEQQQQQQVTYLIVRWHYASLQGHTQTPQHPFGLILSAGRGEADLVIRRG